MPHIEGGKDFLRSLARGSNISHICSPYRFPVHGLKVESFPPLYDALVLEDFDRNTSVGLFFSMAGNGQGYIQVMFA